MRKYLIAAVAAITALAMATVALGQGSDPTATLTVKVTPTKAGTKKKPKSGKLNLKIVNDNTALTMDDLKIMIPATAQIKLKGFKTCTEQNISAGSCPASASLGTGIAEARQGVNGPVQQALFFKVTPFPMSSKQIAFYLEQLKKDANGKPTSETEPSGIRVNAVGTLSTGKKPYAQVLDIAVPKLAQEFPPNSGVFNGLVSLQTTLGKSKGKNKLISLNGCKKGKHGYGAELHFIPNPDPAHAGTARDTADSKCKA